MLFSREVIVILIEGCTRPFTLPSDCYSLIEQPRVLVYIELSSRKWKKDPLTLKAPNKNCSRRHFNFLLLSFEENKERIHLKHQVLFSLKNNEKVFIKVVCCSRD